MRSDRALHSLAPALLLCLSGGCSALRDADFEPTTEGGAISSEILHTPANERVLSQEVWIDAPVEAVWESYTTAEGWTAWASPVAEIDLRVGGTIETHYTPGARIGDEGTIRLHIVNYVPGRLLTLRAELQDNWPDIMKEDADHLMNVIVFESHGPARTRLRSYGVGYRNGPAYDQLLGFFVTANEGLYRALKEHLEARSGAESAPPQMGSGI